MTGRGSGGQASQCLADLACQPSQPTTISFISPVDHFGLVSLREDNRFCVFI